jgi:hypothetical protein
MAVKSWYTSKTIWGVIISFGGKIITAIWGVEVSGADADKVADGIIGLISLGVSFGGDILALYGRVKATKEISPNPLGAKPL